MSHEHFSQPKGGPQYGEEEAGGGYEACVHPPSLLAPH